MLMALAFTLAYLLTALLRVFYPYDLDFIEDSMLMESLRFAEGKSVFGPLNAEFNPLVYMPVYPWLGGALTRWVGPGLVPLRLLSLAATLGTTSLVYWIARREGGQRWVAIGCAGLFLGGYRINGFWYELARVDSLFVVLALGGLAAGVYAGDSSRRWVLSAALLAAAFFTKQTALSFGVGMALYSLVAKRRGQWWFAPTYGLLVAVPLLALNSVTDGWFFYHTVVAGSSEPAEGARLLRYLTIELWGRMGGLSVLAVIGGIAGLRRAGLGIVREQPWWVGILMALVISGAARARVGGNLNTLMPVYTLLCLAPALLAREWGLSAERSTLPGLAPPGRRGLLPWREGLIAALILAQFGLGVYYPPRYIPSREMHRRGERLVERIAAIEGPVLVMMHPYYALLAGKEPSAQIAALWHARGRGALPLPDDLVNRIQNHFYDAIVSDGSAFETEPDLQALISDHYYLAESLDTSEAPSTTTGVVVRPAEIYVPRPP